MPDFFPWHGVRSSVEHGLFGTAIALDDLGEPVVRFYANEAGSDYLHSRVLEALSSEIGVEVRVMQSVDFAAGSCCGGASIGPLNGPTGTLGGWLACNPSGECIGISNNHVLVDYNRFPIGHSILHPGPADGGTANDVVGRLAGFEQLHVFDPRRAQDTINLVDVGWVRPVANDLVDRRVGAGRPIGEVDLVQMYHSSAAPVQVSITGRTSGSMSAVVAGTNATVFLQDGGDGYIFEDQLELEADPGDSFAQGDSGALVLADSHSTVGGLFFAFSPGRPATGFANRWQEIRAVSNLAFSYD